MPIIPVCEEEDRAQGKGLIFPNETQECHLAIGMEL